MSALLTHAKHKGLTIKRYVWYLILYTESLNSNRTGFLINFAHQIHVKLNVKYWVGRQVATSGIFILYV